MVKNELTPAQLASYAQEISRAVKPKGVSQEFWQMVKIIAGSALTQAKPIKDRLDFAIRASTILTLRKA